MKGYKNVGLPKQPSLIIRDKRKIKAWDKNTPIGKPISRKGLRNDKNGTYD